MAIGAGEETSFHQPTSKSITLNRVVTKDASEILGRLTANGQIWLINPNGILFGKDAEVDVGGLLATTNDIADDDFMAGRYVFRSGGGPARTVENQGSITSTSEPAPNVKSEALSLRRARGWCRS